MLLLLTVPHFLYNYYYLAARSSACPGAGLLQPTQGPDGLIFN
jgi:hypothetical protein